MFTKNFLTALPLIVLIIVASPHRINAKGDHYDRIVRHLQTRYQAKKVRIPMLWLARFAVRMARPAGFKSFSLTQFSNLKVASGETLDAEMQTAMRNALSAEWSPILRVRSQRGSQTYMYMCETKKSIKITLVTIDKDSAAVIRAAFSPEKLADFIDNPKILGISLDDDQQSKRE